MLMCLKSRTRLVSLVYAIPSLLTAPCIYLPSMTSAQVYVPSQDPRVLYSGGWSQYNITDFVANEALYMEETTTPSAYATFQFNGTGVTIVGRVPACAYSITVNGTAYSPSPVRNTTNQGNSQLFLLSPGSLAMGQHTLIIRAENATDEMPLYLTAFQYDTSDNPVLPSTAVVVISTVSPAIDSATATAIDPSQSPNRGTSAFPLAIVIGASVGGVLLLILVSIVVWCLFKRKKGSRVEGYKRPEISLPDRFDVTPFDTSTRRPTTSQSSLVHSNTTFPSIYSDSRTSSRLVEDCHSVQTHKTPQRAAERPIPALLSVGDTKSSFLTMDSPQARMRPVNGRLTLGAPPSYAQSIDTFDGSSDWSRMGDVGSVLDIRRGF